MRCQPSADWTLAPCGLLGASRCSGRAIGSQRGTSYHAFSRCASRYDMCLFICSTVTCVPDKMFGISLAIMFSLLQPIKDRNQATPPKLLNEILQCIEKSPYTAGMDSEFSVRFCLLCVFTFSYALYYICSCTHALLFCYEMCDVQVDAILNHTLTAKDLLMPPPIVSAMICSL